MTVQPLLQITGLDVGYGHVGVLRNVALAVAPGSIVALVGSNGAGKSTLLRAISGLLRPSAGRIVFEAGDIAGWRPHRIVDLGIMHVAEGRRLFRRQSVHDNLELGLVGARLDRAAEAERYSAVYDLFPALRERPDVRAGVLSGGQQQMLAIAQALMRRPRLLMLDEPSLGLAPVIVDQLIDVILRLRAGGTTILLVEQMVERALEIADHAYVLQNGVVIGHGTPADIRAGDLIRRAYLGAGSGHATSD
ncbi:ABC transporter ATP-binding protein [Vineibacter terrae]|uniref:ABC transporter ATP-binding protein n=1 Tax=Vineibacter terrae TaxID=2586908 RepID=UPI002E3012FF|nr:ABC transporter ATP-binding protein [Vineibacter terrae]HEX2890561.1 ABC transporter ATP-binding protein [Vineibacter terrae]